jgi:hypothetical protein
MTYLLSRPFWCFLLGLLADAGKEFGELQLLVSQMHVNQMWQ